MGREEGPVDSIVRCGIQMGGTKYARCKWHSERPKSAVPSPMGDPAALQTKAAASSSFPADDSLAMDCWDTPPWSAARAEKSQAWG